MAINFALNPVAIGARLSTTDGPKVTVVRDSVVTVGSIFNAQAFSEYGPLDLLSLWPIVVGHDPTLAESM